VSISSLSYALTYVFIPNILLIPYKNVSLGANSIQSNKTLFDVLKLFYFALKNVSTCPVE
jgi:hypothetical protein